MPLSALTDLTRRFDEYSLIWTGVGLLAVVIIVSLFIRAGAIWVHTRTRRTQLAPALVDRIRAKENKLDFADVGPELLPLAFLSAVVVAMIGTIPFWITVWLDEVFSFGDFSAGLEATATVAAVVATVAVIAGIVYLTFVLAVWALLLGYEARLSEADLRAARDRDEARRAQEVAERRRKEEEARLAARRAARPRLFRRDRPAKAAR